MNLYRLLSVLIHVAVAAMVVCEIVQAVRSLSGRGRVALRHPGHPELANAGQFAQSIGWLGSIDSIVIVTLSRRICVSSGISQVFVSLPVIAASLGSLIGIVLYRPLRNRTGTRSIVSFAYLLYALSALACFRFAARGAFIAICLVKIAAGVASGLLNAVLFRLPSLCGDDEALMREVSTNTENGILTSGILGVFAGGLLSGRGGYASIYVLQAATAVGFLLIGRFIFVRKESRFNNPTREQKREMNGRALGFMFTPAIAALLLVSVVYNGVAMYYKQIVYPLFSDDLGFSEQIISDMYILVRCMIYFGFRFIEKLLRKADNRGILIASSLLLGASFLVFVRLDDSFIWGSAMLLITGIACKLVKNHGTVLWNQELLRQRIKPYYANPPLMALTGAVSVVAPGVLALLLAPGVRLMGAVMGVAAIGFTGLYMLATGKKDGAGAVGE